MKQRCVDYAFLTYYIEAEEGCGRLAASLEHERPLTDY